MQNNNLENQAKKNGNVDTISHIISQHEQKETGSTKKNDVVEFTEIVGNMGTWQRNVFLLLFFGAFPTAWHHLGIGFLAFEMDHWCARKPDFANISTASWKNLSIPSERVDGETRLSQCKMYDGGNTTESYLEARLVNRTVSCNDWEFDTSQFENTIITEWNLVCQSEWMVSMSQSVYMAGFLTAVLVFGQLSDRFGRRPIILLNIAILIISGTITAFSTSFTMFTLTRFFVAMGSSGAYTTAFVLMVEIVGSEYRSTLGLSLGYGWSVGFTVLPGIAWLLKDWFQLQLAITIPCLALVSYYWFFPESPRWLLAHGKMEEASTLIKEAARKNGRKVIDLDAKVKRLCNYAEKEAEATKGQKASVIDLLKTPNLRKRTLNLYFNWFVISFVYYGLSLSSGDLGGNTFLNFFIAGAIEFPSTTMALLCLKYVGRRIPLMVMLIIGGVACILTIFVPDDLLWLRITLAMTGKFSISAAFGTIYVYSAELYPTVARNVGVGSSSMCARLGSIIAPFMKELGKATHIGVALGIYGGMSVIGGLLVLLLPETRNKDVPDTLQQAENFGKKHSVAQNENEMEKM